MEPQGRAEIGHEVRRHGGDVSAQADGVDRPDLFRERLGVGLQTGLARGKQNLERVDAA